jgi:hypothetical protein
VTFEDGCDGDSGTGDKADPDLLKLRRLVPEGARTPTSVVADDAFFEVLCSYMEDRVDGRSGHEGGQPPD